MSGIISDKKVKICNILFAIQWILFLAGSIFSLSAWYELDETSLMNTGYRGLKCVCALICLVIVIIKFLSGKYNRQAIVAYLLLAAVVAVTAYYSENIANVWYFAIFAAAYKEDAKKTITISVIVTVIMMAVIIGCSYTEIGIDYIFDAEERARHGLGFGWTTTPPILFLFLSMEYLCIRGRKMKILEYVILEAIAVYFYVMTNTRFTFAVTTLLIVIMCIEGMQKNSWRVWRKLKWFWLCIPVMICILCLAMYIFYDRDNSTWQFINNLMGSRLTIGQNVINSVEYTWFGQYIHWNGYSIADPVAYYYNYVDCSYIQIMLQYGFTFLAATVAIYTNAIYNSIKANKYNMIFILVVILVFSVMEPRLMNMMFNIFPLMSFVSLKETE